MATSSARLGLRIPTTADQFSTENDLAANWRRLEANPGIHICTSTTRPTWAAAHAGMLISETDTGLLWRWDGTQFLRVSGKGYLGGAVRTSDIQTANESPNFFTIVSATIAVPAGGRLLQILAEAPNVQNPKGAVRMAIFRAANQLTAWNVLTDAVATPPREGPSGSYSTFDTPPAAEYAYTLRFASLPTADGYGGTSLIEATANSPISLRVIEL